MPLYVWQVTEEEVREYLGTAGLAEPLSVRLPKDTETGQLKGIGFVEFGRAEEAKAGLRLGGEDFMGRTLKADLAEARRGPRPAGGGGGGGGQRSTVVGEAARRTVDAVLGGSGSDAPDRRRSRSRDRCRRSNRDRDHDRRSDRDRDWDCDRGDRRRERSRSGDR